jgi:hypothetical protein
MLWKLSSSATQIGQVMNNGSHMNLKCANAEFRILWWQTFDKHATLSNIIVLGKTGLNNTETTINKEVGLEVNTEKTKYMLLSSHRNAGQNHDIKTANRSFENVAQFRYLGTKITDQNLIQEEIKRRLNLSYACYHCVLKLSSSHLLSKNVKIRIYKT